VHGGGIHQRWLQRARATRTADGAEHQYMCRSFPRKQGILGHMAKES